MALRKRKITNPYYNNGNQSRSITEKPEKSEALFDSVTYQSIILTITDQTLFHESESLVPSSQVSNETDKAVDMVLQETVKQPMLTPPPPPPPLVNPIPLPPPTSDCSARAAGVVAELLTLRGSQIKKFAPEQSDMMEHESKKYHDQDEGSSRPVLERFPNKLPSSTTGQGINVHATSGVVGPRAATNKRSQTTISAEDDDESKYLLSQLDEVNVPENETEKLEKEDVDRSLFVQELLLSMLASNIGSDLSNSNREQTSTVEERAIPIDCPLMSSTPTHAVEKACNSDTKSSEDRDVALNDADLFAKEKQHLASSESNEESHDTGMGNSMVAETSGSPVGFSMSASHHVERLGNNSAVSSRSAPALGAGRVLPGNPQWNFETLNNEDEKRSDDDKPPSPTPPLQQRHGLRLQGRVYASGPVRLAGGVPNTAALNDYTREDVASVGLNKHIR